MTPVVHVRFFAWAREKMGHDLVTIPLDKPLSLSSFMERLFQNELLELKPYRKEFLVAVNEVYVQPESYEIRGGEEVALIPPVSGGSLGV